MNDDMNFEDILGVIKKYLAFIVFLTILSGAITLAFTYFFMTPQYEANTQVLVSQSESNSSFNNLDIETSLQLINTYGEIIQSPIVLSDVIDNLELNQPVEELAQQVSVITQESSQVINITVIDEEQSQAAILANEIANVFQDKVTEVMNVNNVSVLAPANTESSAGQVSPRPELNTFIGMVIGALLGLIIAFVRTYFDKSVKTVEEVEKYLDLPVLGMTTRFDK